MACAVTWLDVFTPVPMAGNGLAVVHDADGLDDAAMLAFARETRLSETTFVQAGDDEADYRNRIFTTLREIPFAGHPSLGTAVAVARAAGRDEASYVQRTHAGLQPVDVRRVDGEVWRATMLQEPATFGAEADAVEVLAAVGLEPADAHPELPVQSVSTGVAHVMVPVCDATALQRCRPDLARLRAVTAEHEAVVLYVFALDPAEPGTARARGFFEDPAGVVEDPATGSAAGPLCAFLHARTGAPSLVVSQGAEMGRPSRLEAAVEGDRVRVSGEAVVVLDATLLHT